MGFSVTIANTIIFLALLVVGSSFAASVMNTADAVGDSAREDWRIRADYLHTSLNVSNASYNPTTKIITVQSYNIGHTTLNASKVTLLVDGTYVPIATTIVDGDSSQRVWAPTQGAVFTSDLNLMTILFGPTYRPARVAVVAENGVAAFKSPVYNQPILGGGVL